MRNRVVRSRQFIDGTVDVYIVAECSTEGVSNLQCRFLDAIRTGKPVPLALLLRGWGLYSYFYSNCEPGTNVDDLYLTTETKMEVRRMFGDIVLRNVRSMRNYVDNKNVEPNRPEIDKVIFHDPATIVYWKDGSKTVVKCRVIDTYSKETGLALCYMKKILGNKGNYNDIFRKWIKEG